MITVIPTPPYLWGPLGTKKSYPNICVAFPPSISISSRRYLSLVSSHPLKHPLRGVISPSFMNKFSYIQPAGVFYFSPTVTLISLNMSCLRGSVALQSDRRLCTANKQDVHFPFAEGLLLLHSTRIESLPMEERRARARRGRRTLHRIGACLIPPADRHRSKEEAGGGVDRGATSAAAPTVE